jgi:hypothetical protein
MQPFKFWFFIWRSLGRAVSEFARFIGWDVKTVVTTVALFGLGYFIYWKVKGAAETKDELGKYALLIFIPYLIFAIVLFAVQIFRAPYLVYRDEFSKSEQRLNEAEQARADAENGKAASENARQMAESRTRDLEKRLAECQNAKSVSVAKPQSPTFSNAEAIVLANRLSEAKGNTVTIVTVGGVESSAISGQIQEAFKKAGWIVNSGTIGQMNITVVGDSGGGRVDVRGLQLIARQPTDPAVANIVSSFEQARHPVSLNGSRFLQPRGAITLYVAF